MGSLFVFGATEQPPIGGIIGIVVFFGAIIALSLWATKSGSKKSANKIREKYAGQIIDEGVFSKSMHYFFTKDEFLAQKYNDVFAIYRLGDISAISVRWDSVQRSNVLFMTDAEGNKVKPSEVIGGTKSAQKMFGKNLLSMGKDDMEKLCGALLRHAPHIRFEQAK